MLTDTHTRSLARRFHKRQWTLEPAEMLTYEVDAGFDRALPDGVFYPQSHSDVERIVQWAMENGVPLVARGAGTGLAGGAVAERGGIVLEFARMDRITEFDARGRAVRVEPGVVNAVLDAQASARGFYFPPDPSSGRSATLGGNLGTNAGGPHCFKYGVTTNYVTGLEVVLADGRTVQLGGRALDYPEFDFCAPLVGSEGTLGIITGADLRLLRHPPGVKTMMVAFDSEAQAGLAVSAVIAAGLVPATMEMMDQRSMRMVDEFMETETGLPVHAGAALIVEVDGYPESLDAQMEEVADIFAHNGGFDIRIAQSEEERQRIWYGRKSAAGAFSRLSPNYYLTDVTVPRSKLGPVMARINEICARYRVTTCNFFHAGDGNLHPLILCDVRDAELMQRVHCAGKEIIQLCIAHDGSITGEHGVGMEKRQYMPAMYSAAELSAMRNVKEIFDPRNLLNPGKIFPDELPPPPRSAPHMPQEAPFAPATAAEAAAGLRALGEAGRTVRIGGAAADDPGEADIWLSTARLDAMSRFAAEDLFVTIGAGMSLSVLDDFLAEHNLQVALASPWPAASVGGLLSANVNAPLRMRYGSLRDNLLCATVALADGRVIRAGRPVVKNVAGYDLPKVFVGAHGTLGLLVDVTLKLTPRPRARRTLQIPVNDVVQGSEWAAALAPRLLVAAGVVLHEAMGASAEHAAPFCLTCTLEGLPEDVQREMTETRSTLRQRGAPDAHELDPASTQTASQRWAAFVGDGGQGANAPEALVRVGVPAAHVATYWQMVDPAARAAASWLIDPIHGLLYARRDAAELDSMRRWLAALREPALALRGYAVLMSAPDNILAELDPWGYRPDALHLMRALKQRWDPHAVLNPGRFLV